MTMPTRGRPRRYDPDRALDAALAVFWAHGFAGTTLDALCAAMDMNRPSVYAAFGDKRRLFEQALSRFGARLAAHGRAALAAPDLADALGSLFAGVIPLYVPDGRPRGCLVYGVAAVDAPEDEAVRAFVADAVGGL
ncbi:MAG: TetR/AcrR family transcriptional regulator, partial [Myxococcales bacterium]|nr:TetR/AcrR family transcriptional regulator [Myxococcales bacterium]